MSAFTDLLKKATDAISSLRGSNNYFLGKNGDIVYSKNNVCVHEVAKQDTPKEDNVQHIPGYLTIHCQNDEECGLTLILQWLPNETLQKNPASIRSVSPRGHDSSLTNAATAPLASSSYTSSASQQASSQAVENERTAEDVIVVTSPDASKQTELDAPGCAPPSEISIEMNGDIITVISVDTTQSRPQTLAREETEVASHSAPLLYVEGGHNSAPKPKAFSSSGVGNDLFVPSINVIPNTPMEGAPSTLSEDEDTKLETHSQSSVSTSGADSSDKEEEGVKDSDSSSCDESEHSASVYKGTHQSPSALDRYRQECSTLFRATPEQLAHDAGLALNEGGIDDGTEGNEGAVAIARGRVHFTNKSCGASLFSVNLGKMRSMRVFYSNPANTCGQIVIASRDSHYKILHFHHGGLDKLAQLFEQWSRIKAKSVKDGSPSALPDKQLIIWQAAVSKSELDPEDGLYEPISPEFWKAYKNAEGAIDDSVTLRKAIYFASMDPSLRKEIWPFLLRVYPWESTQEQREATRNDLFLEYQSIKRKRLKRSTTTMKEIWTDIENTVVKDVVRTDRNNPYFEGEDNPNMITMKNILLNYAAAYPEVNYIQGMSDLLAPLLSTIREEAETYSCFVGLMQNTLFSAAPVLNHENLMELNLEYLRELLRIYVPDFFQYLKSLEGDAMQIMFVHRWILLCFKREFPESDALHIWEACWSRYRTNYFHLFVCAAIVSVYGEDVLTQRLPHDEILLYFSSLAMHMDQRVVLKKARGLLYEVCRGDRLPCTLGGLVDSDASEQWHSHRLPLQYECIQAHGDEPCPFAS